MAELKKNHIYISLGSNLGDRKKNLARATAMIGEAIGRIVSRSHLYETEPWGHHDQPDFYNQVVEVTSDLEPGDIMKQLLLIEETLGRVRTFKNASRLIDLDILFYRDRQVQKNGVIIPHPHVADRRFVLQPLCEIAPDFMDPVRQKSVCQLLQECNDPLEVKMVKS